MKIIKYIFLLFILVLLFSTNSNDVFATCTPEQTVCVPVSTQYPQGCKACSRDGLNWNSAASEWCNWCNGSRSSSSSSQASSSSSTAGGSVDIEPNNNFSTASGPLISGQTYNLHIGPSDRNDYFYINLQSQHSIEGFLSNFSSSVNLSFYLYSSNRCGNNNCLVAYSGEPGNGIDEHFLANNIISGRYYIRVVSRVASFTADDDYTLRVIYQDASSSSSSSSRVSLPQDNVPPNPAKDVRVEFIHGNGTTIEDSIKFSWAWNGDRTCDGCEPAVEYCAFVKPTPGGSLITGYPTGRSTGPTPFPCNPDEFGPFWWQIVNESTGQVYKQFYSGAQNIQNIMKGLTINVLDNQGRLYPPGGTTYAVVCTDDESFNNRHDVFRIDIETRDARGKITGLQGSTYPNIKSIKASCCFSQAMGNADCNKNTDNSPIIDNSDFTIWKEEYLSTRLTKWSDFDTNSVVALKDFEIWRHNRYDPNPGNF